MSLNSLARRLDRLEFLVRSGWLEHFRRIAELHKSIGRGKLYTNEWAFIMKLGYVPRCIGHEVIFDQLKQFAKQAPRLDHPAWAGIDDLLWYVEPGQRGRWDRDAWADVWRFVKLVRRMPAGRRPVRSEKHRWLRQELAGLRLHMGVERLDEKKELRQLNGQSGAWVRAVMEDTHPPSVARQMETRRRKLTRRRERRRVKRAAVLARKALVRQALGQPAAPATPPPDPAGWLFNAPAFG